MQERVPGTYLSPWRGPPGARQLRSILLFDLLELALVDGLFVGRTAADDAGVISGRSAYEKAINKGKFEQVKEQD